MIEHSVLGVRSRVQAGATIRDSLVMGQDYLRQPGAGAGPGCPAWGSATARRSSATIVDKNARIGDDVRISPAGKPAFFDGPNYYIRDGIVIIPKNAVIMNGTVI